MTIGRITGWLILFALLAGTPGCRNEVQPPTIPVALPMSEMTKHPPKPRPIDLKRDIKPKSQRPPRTASSTPAK